MHRWVSPLSSYEDHLSDSVREISIASSYEDERIDDFIVQSCGAVNNNGLGSTPYSAFLNKLNHQKKNTGKITSAG